MKNLLPKRQILWILLSLLIGGFQSAQAQTYHQSTDSLGLVVIQTENFTINKDGTGPKLGDLWQFGTDTAGYFGSGYMQSVMLGGGDGSTTNAETVNAKLTYNVEFVNTGTHYIWAYVYYPSGSEDSFWYGIDSTVADRMDNSNWNTWLWDQGNSSFNVDSGSHTLDIMQREPGAIVDMIIVSSNPNFDPRTNDAWEIYLPKQVVFVTPSDSSIDTTMIKAIDAYEDGNTFIVSVLEKSIIDSSDLAQLNAADVVVMGRNINSGDVGAATAIWDAIERPVLSVNMWGLRDSRANWVPGLNCENINDTNAVVNGIIQNNDPVFEGLTDTVPWWNGHHSAFNVDPNRMAAGNGTLMVESEDMRPLFIRWRGNKEFYPGAGHQPNNIRSFIGMGSDDAGGGAPNYFGFTPEGETVFFNELLRMANYGVAPQYEVVYVTPSNMSNDAVVIEEIDAYNGGDVFGVTVLEKSVIDSTDLVQLDKADVVVLGRNINSGDVGAAASVWDAIERPVLSLGMYGLRSSRANWVPAPLDCENIDADTVIVNGIIQKYDPVFEGISDTAMHWIGRYAAFNVDTARVAAGNGDLLLESEDARPLFIRWDADEEFYPGAGHQPNNIRSYLGLGIDDRNGNPPSYFGFSPEGETVFFRELLRMANFGDSAVEVVFVTPSDMSNDTTAIKAIASYNNNATFKVDILQKAVIDTSDLAQLDAADVVILGRNINSGDVGAATEVWDAIRKPVLAMGMYGLRSSRANWVPSPLDCENIDLDTVMVNGTILTTDPVFENLTGTVSFWSGRYSAFNVDSARVAAGNGTLLMESEDLRPLFIRWEAHQEYYPGAGHQPSGIRSYLGLGIDNPPSYFAFSTEGETIFFNELLRMGAFGLVADTTVSITSPIDLNVKLYPNPVNDLVKVEADFNIQHIQVLNIMGARIMSEEINSKETVLDMSSLSSGFYFVIMKGQKGTRTFKLKKN